jgi:hypothetical protein
LPFAEVSLIFFNLPMVGAMRQIFRNPRDPRKQGLVNFGAGALA